MCGRYTATWSPEAFKRSFNVQPSLFESFNIAPTQYAPIVWQPQGNTEVLNARWGLIPKWVDKPFEFKASMFNARAETLSEKASFKRPFKRQRCLVPASGFYEWKKAGSSKEPYYLHAEDGSVLAFAGLYDHWQKGDDEIYSYTIITTAANDVMSALHDRMPVILPPAHYGAWLNPESEGELLEPLLKPYEEELEAYLVDKRVGRVSENDAGLLEPVGLEGPTV